MTEIRLHGRGGQGAVTTTELLAMAAIQDGNYAQAFPSFGPERRGAPVVAYARISKGHIRIRSKVYEPHVVMVLDPTLLKLVKVDDGMREGGVLIVNTHEGAEAVAEYLESNCRIVTIDATSIAKEIIGRPITNTTMIGAFVRITGLVSLKSLERTLEDRFGRLAERNIMAMRKAYDSVNWR